ncbi:MAG TPA: GNAT family N-acetyltransferase [Anaerolineales bacterium]|nr:GNAT family N-acetyltransferase [Anaerolineales bacterium]
MKIERVSPDEIGQVLAGLVNLLQDSVTGGASIGFLLPFTYEDGVAYWQEVAQALKTPYRVLLVANEDEKIIGSVQLDLASRPNGGHRAEVSKLMVHSSCRNRGIAQALLGAVEQAAREARRTTLVLDTREGDPSERLYLKMGYVRAGTIPDYARSTDGSLHATVFMYKLLQQH